MLGSRRQAAQRQFAGHALVLELEQRNEKLCRELEAARARIETLEAAVPPGLDVPDSFDRRMMMRAQYADPEDATTAAAAWRRAFITEPVLIRHLVRIGGLFAGLPRLFQQGEEVVEPIDPVRLAVMQGRREAVLEILAHSLTSDEINQTLETSYED